MKVLLSPAKAIDMTKKVNTDTISAPIFMDDAEYLMNKMSKFSARKIGEMMHLSSDLSELNFDRNQNWKSSSDQNNENAQAIGMFNGEVYRGFDALSLTKAELNYTQETVRILSGLYGILKPLDVIYPYRLEMGTSWAITPKKKGLYNYWGSKISSVLNEEESEVIVNLASNEYFKAANLKAFKNGGYKTIMVFAKQSRGKMARYIVDNKITDPEVLKGYDLDGYRYDENLSEGDNWTFTR
jgi:cytoplasmic iron level regulating protein YaaA (DUF328/UPF0246 family)